MSEETALDSQPDATLEAGAEAEANVEAHVEAAVEAQVEAGAGADAGLDTEVDTEAGAVAEATAETVDEVAEEKPAAKAVKRRGDRAARKAAKKAKQPSAARKWLSANKTRVMVISSAASFVLASAFAAGAFQPMLAERATIATKLKIARTAADAISTLWSYTPENMSTLSDRAAQYLGGDFEEQYRKYVDAIAETNKQAKVTSETQVVGAAVESLNGSDATALVYTNTTSTTGQSNTIPSMQYLSYRLELKRYGRDWRVTRMTTVTSLDLTPKI